VNNAPHPRRNLSSLRVQSPAKHGAFLSNPHPFTLLRTLLHSARSYPASFHHFLHSLPQTPGGVYLLPVFLCDSLRPLRAQRCPFPHSTEGGSRLTDHLPRASRGKLHLPASLSFQSLTNCPDCKPFLLIFIQHAGGGPPLANVRAQLYKASQTGNGHRDPRPRGRKWFILPSQEGDETVQRRPAHARVGAMRGTRPTSRREAARRCTDARQARAAD